MCQRNIQKLYCSEITVTIQLPPCKWGAIKSIEIVPGLWYRPHPSPTRRGREDLALSWPMSMKKPGQETKSSQFEGHTEGKLCGAVNRKTRDPIYEVMRACCE